MHAAHLPSPYSPPPPFAAHARTPADAVVSPTRVDVQLYILRDHSDFPPTDVTGGGVDVGAVREELMAVAPEGVEVTLVVHEVRVCGESLHRMLCGEGARALTHTRVRASRTLLGPAVLRSGAVARAQDVDTLRNGSHADGGGRLCAQAAAVRGLANVREHGAGACAPPRL